MHPRINICNISPPEKAKLAENNGACAHGIVDNISGGTGVIRDETIAKVTSTVSPGHNCIKRQYVT